MFFFIAVDAVRRLFAGIFSSLVGFWRESIRGTGLVCVLLVRGRSAGLVRPLLFSPLRGYRRALTSGMRDSSLTILRCLLRAQGDTYEELGVTVTDKNEDDSTRTVKIEYSQPFGELRSLQQSKSSHNESLMGYMLNPSKTCKDLFLF